MAVSTAVKLRTIANHNLLVLQDGGKFETPHARYLMHIMSDNSLLWESWPGGGDKIAGRIEPHEWMFETR